MADETGKALESYTFTHSVQVQNFGNVTNQYWYICHQCFCMIMEDDSSNDKAKIRVVHYNWHKGLTSTLNTVKNVVESLGYVNDLLKLRGKDAAVHS